MGRDPLKGRNRLGWVTPDVDRFNGCPTQFGDPWSGLEYGADAGSSVQCSKDDIHHLPTNPRSGGVHSLMSFRSGRQGVSTRNGEGGIDAATTSVDLRRRRSGPTLIVDICAVSFLLIDFMPLDPMFAQSLDIDHESPNPIRQLSNDLGDEIGRGGRVESALEGKPRLSGGRDTRPVPLVAESTARNTWSSA